MGPTGHIDMCSIKYKQPSKLTALWCSTEVTLKHKLGRYLDYFWGHIKAKATT